MAAKAERGRLIAAYPDRDFQLWEYVVSHGSLLIRSPRRSDATNVDIMFAGVDFISCPRHLRGLEVFSGAAQDAELLSKLLDSPVAADGVFTLATGGSRHFVIAAGCQVAENERDIFWSPFGDAGRGLSGP